MDIRVLEEIFDELISSLESVESRNAATVQFLKAKGIAKDEELAPYLEEARAASSVRWRAARARLRRILSSAVEAEERAQEKATEEAREKQPGGQTGKAGTQDDKEELTKQAAELTKAPGTEAQGKQEPHDKQAEGTSTPPRQDEAKSKEQIAPSSHGDTRAKAKEDSSKAEKQAAAKPKEEGAFKPRDAA
jgi:hypothetical protein